MNTMHETLMSHVATVSTVVIAALMSFATIALLF